MSNDKSKVKRTISLSQEGETALINLCAAFWQSPDEVIELSLCHLGSLVAILTSIEAASLERGIEGGLKLLEGENNE